MNTLSFFSRATALAALAAGAALPAQAVTFNYTAQGFGVSGECNQVANCLEAFTVGAANDLGSLVPGTWSQFLNLRISTATGAVTGTWTLSDDTSAFNDLMGTVSGTWEIVSATQARALLSYTVTGGNGMFTGATGGGTSTLLADAELNYTESGAFNVTLVPEPASWALMLGGLAWGAVRLRRSAEAAGDHSTRMPVRRARSA